MGCIELLKERVPSSCDLTSERIFDSKVVNELSQEEIARILKLCSQEEVLNILLVYSNIKYEGLGLGDRKELIDLIFGSESYTKFIESCKIFCIKDLDSDKTRYVIESIMKIEEEFQIGYIRRISELPNINRSINFTSLIGLFIKIKDKDVCLELYNKLLDLNDEDAESELTLLLKEYSNSINKVKIKTLINAKGRRLRR